MSRKRKGVSARTDVRPAASDAAAASPTAAAPTWDTARRLLLVVLAISLLLSVLFAVGVPDESRVDPRTLSRVVINPDEKAHLDYVRLIVENKGFVRFIAGDQERFETHQPPLYYLLAVPFYLVGGGSLFAVRLLSAVLQLVTILVVFRACRDLFPERPYLALSAAAFAAFLPTQAQLAGAVNNDALTTLICAAIFWRAGLLVVRGATTRDAALLGLLLGAGLLTKLSVLQVVPAILAAFAIAAHARRMDAPRAAALFGLTLLMGVTVASPWLVRNHLLYGDPLTLKIYASTGPNFTPPMIRQAAGWTVADYLRQVGIRSYATFWYFLPPGLPFNRFVGNPLPLLLVLLLGLGGLLGTLRSLARGEGSADKRRVLLLFVLGTLFLVPFFARFVLTVFQAQGRYFLPALLPIAVVCCGGWAALAGRSRTVGALGVGVLLLALAVYAALGGSFA